MSYTFLANLDFICLPDQIRIIDNICKQLEQICIDCDHDGRVYQSLGTKAFSKMLDEHHYNIIRKFSELSELMHMINENVLFIIILLRKDRLRWINWLTKEKKKIKGINNVAYHKYSRVITSLQKNVNQNLEIN